MVNSKKKGSRGEREFSQFLKERGIEARRGQQYSGSPDSPDVISSLEHIHWEVKRVEALQIHKAMYQAKADAGANQTPVVAYRKNREEWLVILTADDFIKLLPDLS